ncbi:MAG: sugar phosphate isomerase/epimerase [Fimbriimonadaceae bacterium]|nr:sugar phosphate isomerase/epimerase [Fimbriimonadaceae bacterium]
MRRCWMLGVALLVSACAQAQEPAGFKPCAVPGWRLGLQAWTMNKLTVVEVIDQCKQLGIEYLECFPGQKVAPDLATGFAPGCSDEAKARVKAKLAETGVKLVQFGVAGIPGDEPGARRFFDWCKEMGITGISTEPDPRNMPLLSKLSDEYQIRIAIHNHPKPSRYWDPQTVLETVKDCGPLVGACADTGHWPRSEVNSVEALKKLEGRIMSLHFKDLNKAEKGGHDVPWGSGACDAKGMLSELQRQGFQGLFSIEYEVWNAEQFENLKKCVAWFQATTDELAKAK